jgi:hypothetical protein
MGFCSSCILCPFRCIHDCCFLPAEGLTTDPKKVRARERAGAEALARERARQMTHEQANELNLQLMLARARDTAANAPRVVFGDTNNVNRLPPFEPGYVITYGIPGRGRGGAIRGTGFGRQAAADGFQAGFNQVAIAEGVRNGHRGGRRAGARGRQQRRRFAGNLPPENGERGGHDLNNRVVQGEDRDGALPVIDEQPQPQEHMRFERQDRDQPGRPPANPVPDGREDGGWFHHDGR